jgi:hypothetical protein
VLQYFKNSRKDDEYNETYNDSLGSFVLVPVSGSRPISGTTLGRFQFGTAHGSSSNDSSGAILSVSANKKFAWSCWVGESSATRAHCQNTKPALRIAKQ